MHSSVKERLLRRFAPVWEGDYCCPIGWERTLMPQLLEELEANPGVELHQIKEKFGALRIYSTASDDHQELINLIDKLEAASLQTCKRCGGPSTHGEEAVAALCPKCRVMEVLER